MAKVQVLAYYLPQYHPIPENDAWWGKGFTEWTNVAKARPLFKGHRQPLLPADLGYYDLRLTEARKAQAKLAKEHGIDGFIYYQYWFGNGKKLLELPAEEMLKEGKPDFPFCFCWANETWKGIWHGVKDPKILMEQKYGGPEDYLNYFNYLLPFFKDSRYIKVDNKPMFHIYRIEDIPDMDVFLKIFNDNAIKQGFDGVYFVATGVSGLDTVFNNKYIFGQVGMEIFQKMRYNQNTFFKEDGILVRFERKIRKMLGYSIRPDDRTKPIIYDYKKGVSNLHIKFPHTKYIACVFPNWDNSARSGMQSLIFKNAHPQYWQEHLQKAVDELKMNPGNPPYIVIKSWNEWAEGNYLEPDRDFGLQWLEAVKKVKMENGLYEENLSK